MTVHPLRPATRHRLGRPSPHQQADRPRAHPPPKTPKGASFPDPPCDRPRISRISHTFMRLSRRRGQVTHVLLTRSPLIQNQQKPVPSPFDLHVLSTPPAFVLSQDQTLQTKPTKPGPNQPQTSSQPEPTVSTTVQKTRPGPTQPPQQRGPGKPKQNKTPKTTHNQNHAQPQGHGIKNMTHYRVLKQHTHRDLRPGRIPCLPLEGDRTSISRLSFGNQTRIA